MSRTKRMVRSSAMAIAAAAALTVAVPASSAYAIDEVPCQGRTDLLKVEGHSWGGSLEICYANAGRDEYPGGIWVDRISTGNNDITYYDVNGATVQINRWTVFQPRNAVHVNAIQIW
ncbi:beta/gamma crystallin domain-containing protein [Streptomyces sp. NPDC021080]|uniref:beta/gamma crystallin domain-containing protein n=1 Tax=Streptomyces sp. NPDC021080 TaxID=3365110 RepID=UPI00378FFCB7